MALLPVSSLYPCRSRWSGVKILAEGPFLFLPGNPRLVKAGFSFCGGFFFLPFHFLVTCFFSLVSLRQFERSE